MNFNCHFLGHFLWELFSAVMDGLGLPVRICGRAPRSAIDISRSLSALSNIKTRRFVATLQMEILWQKYVISKRRRIVVTHHI